MVVGAEFPQRRVKLWGEKQHEQAGKERYLGAIVTEIEVIYVREAEVDRHQGHRDGGEKLQHGRAQEGEPQHLHGALPKIFRGVANGFTLRLGTHEELQGTQALESVEEVAGEPRQGLEVAAVGIGSADAHQDHEERDEGRCAEQDDAGGPVDREHGHQDHQGDEDGYGHLGQIAGEELLHLFNLLEQQAGPAAGGAALDISWPEAGEAGEHQLADGLAHRTARLEACHLTAIGQCGLGQGHQQQGDKEGNGLLGRGAFDDEAVEQGGQQPGLHHHQYALAHAQTNGKTDPAPAMTRLFAQPAIEMFLLVLVHYHPPRSSGARLSSPPRLGNLADPGV